jgi:hypothetical protein
MNTPKRLGPGMVATPRSFPGTVDVADMLGALLFGEPRSGSNADSVATRLLSRA